MIHLSAWFHKALVTTLVLISFTVFTKAGQTDTISIRSVIMNKDIRCVVIRPDPRKSKGKRFPVVYLLHGYSGSYNQWPKLAPQLPARADELQMIIVCVDGGFSSWYFDSPVDSTYRYETYVSREVVEYVDKAYPTLADREHRAITGLSMGGHGGLYLALRHQAVYGAAGSTSGGVDIRPFPKNWDLAQRLGDSTCCYDNWNRNTVINLVDSLKNGALAIIFDCGTQDFFLGVNRALHEKLLGLKVDHDYTERPGGHNSKYWQNSIDYQLVFFSKYFRKA